jgi:hypothetical protein
MLYSGFSALAHHGACHAMACAARPVALEEMYSAVFVDGVIGGIVGKSVGSIY